MAIVILPNGQARIGRQDGRYYVDTTEWDGHENDREPWPCKYELKSYADAATWLARELGHDGALDVRVDFE
ncbi:hypothetical protein [Streptomyces antarcticus]|uniref:hypothetical protein n=1 Tax=Streptomyces antarcticus TaxID=2996458 RepID=UPI00226FBDAA|nr:MULTISPECIES: hypothetical protein [unclassified Streptomyces]MCY0941924.1 hypothetical protein [Streptomyces sp. H34-AA3]MCZ4082803.1 hypothetical protein [Streptomyces sp. H34-S5]